MLPVNWYHQLRCTVFRQIVTVHQNPTQTNSMRYGPSSVAGSRLASQEILRILWNRKILLLCSQEPAFAFHPEPY